MDLATESELFQLDGEATDVLGEARRLHARGRLVPAVADGIRCWATGDHEVAMAVLKGDTFKKHPRHWADLRNGLVPDTVPILEFVTMPGMLNEDDHRHRELRGLVSSAFTPRRVEELRPRIEAIVDELIAELSQASPASPDSFIDLRHRFAFPLPMQVICHLFGLDLVSSETLAWDYATLHDSRSSPEQAAEAKAAVLAVIAGLIADKRQNPGDDLASALIGATNGEGATLDDELLLYTLMLFLFAGHETTTNLISNALKALSQHPDQLARVRAGEVPVKDVVEEVLRYNSPIHSIMFRYATEDTEVPGTDVTVKKGDAVAVFVAATGRDTAVFGPQSDVFDPSRRPAASHLSFGQGAHFCIGAPLARMMATTALTKFLRHFDWDPTGAPATRPISSYSSNADTAYFARLSPRKDVPLAA
ncbi:cytochrome P450 [Streptomyces sp. NPDC026672]|uniref:cytochrome P450 n=1 Tax=unclassified Streptomyces TaxID=2593676 RepID=UPI0033FEABCE